MSLSNLVRSLLNKKKLIPLSILPSQGLFYDTDFIIHIKRAGAEDIQNYKAHFIRENLGLIIYKVKKIVEKNLILSKSYSFGDLKSIDVVFLFLEIVRFTKGSPIEIKFTNPEGQSDFIEFSPHNFNYFILDDLLLTSYNKDQRCFELEGYKFSLPSIGIENSLTDFLIKKQQEWNYKDYTEIFFDFTYFLADKKSLTHSQIENLIQIFNYDLPPEELDKIQKILKTFQPLQRYSLLREGRVIDINSKIDLEFIWE